MNNLIEKAEKHVIHLINEQLNNSFIYHNLAHTQLVVKKTKELSKLSALKEKQINRLVLSAWFHDTGYTERIDNHEIYSAEIASNFLRSEKVSEDDISAICDLILATKMDFVPTTISEKIIRDADCAHIGTKSFEDSSELLRKELELTSDKVISDSEWLNGNIDFLSKTHRFYSDAASSNWDKVKSKNLSKLLKAKKKITQEDTKLNQKIEELNFKKSKVELPERGIETMFRVTLKNHFGS